MFFTALPTDQYETLLDAKAAQLKALMSPFSPPDLIVYPSPKQHYRMRAEFRIWHDGDHITHVMFDPHTKQRININTFPSASRLINQAIPVLIQALSNDITLSNKLFQIDYHSTLSGQLMITLIYHKPLEQTWLLAAKELRNLLQNQGLNLELIGRAAKQKYCLSQDFVEEQLTVDGEVITYRQIENNFTQPNTVVNISMLEWAINATKSSHGDLLELYCGNGNFSLALAKNFRRVIATEISKSSVAAAQYNCAANNIDNVIILRLSAEELLQAFEGVRTFNRLDGISLADYDCQTLLVDPPRSGLSEALLDITQQFTKIIYISCNPQTLYENLMQLTQTHTITEFALFDQFPYTPHMECGVVLEKRES